MARKPSLVGFKQVFTPIEFEDETINLKPSAEGLTVILKGTKQTIVIPARYMIAVEKVGKSVKVLYEQANEDTESEGVEEVSSDDELEALLA